MESQELIPSNNRPEPTTQQRERAAQLNRFNWLYVYLPVLVIAISLIVIVVWLLVVSLQPEDVEARQTVSAMADGFLILAIIPMLIICGSLPTLAVIVTVQARRRGVAPIAQLQRLLWRIDMGVGMVKHRTRDITSKLARPLISLRAKVTYIRTLLNQIISILKRR